MSVLRVTKYGEPVLRQKARDFDWKNHGPQLQSLLKDMWATMEAARGVGLAAPQIGLALRLAVIDVKPQGESRRVVLINPVIVSKQGFQQEEEGCLSIPGLYAPIHRAARVVVRAVNEKGLPVEWAGEGLLARAFQHELDHLNGKLFIDHLPLFSRLKVKRLIRKLKREWG
ncbi:MAG: peptide deformylase [Elusimicrobia bacterium]|nr:peptide deformylase [Elusimicrobiota bacterium]